MDKNTADAYLLESTKDNTTKSRDILLLSAIAIYLKILVEKERS